MEAKQNHVEAKWNRAEVNGNIFVLWVYRCLLLIYYPILTVVTTKKYPANIQIRNQGK